MIALHTDLAAGSDERARDRDLHEALRRLIAGLPEPYAMVLSRVDLDGVTLAEVATSLGLGTASVRLLYAEGRRRLRAIVLHHSEAGTL